MCMVFQHTVTQKDKYFKNYGDLTRRMMKLIICGNLFMTTLAMAIRKTRAFGILPAVFYQNQYLFPSVGPKMLLQTDKEITRVTKSLNYIRQADKYAATTSQSQVSSTSIQHGSDAATLKMLLEKVHYQSKPDHRSIKNLTKNELVLLLTLLSQGQFPGVWSQSMTQNLDSECARRVGMWGGSTCLLTLDIWLQWLGPKTVLNLTFFKVLLKEWHLVPDRDDPAYLTQLLYYIGLTKRAPPQQLMQAIESGLEKNLSSLNDEDMIIVCQGFFKSSTKITSPLLLHDVVRRVKLIASGCSDASGLIAFLKVLRHARLEDLDLCVQLIKFLKGFRSDGTLVECAHYAAFFANCRYYDRALFCRFEDYAHDCFTSELALARSKKTTFVASKLSRMKDVARMLWSLSELGHRPVHTDFWSTGVAYLRMRVRIEKSDLKPQLFVDCLHSLAVIGVLPTDLLDVISCMSFGTPENSVTAHRQIYSLYESAKIELCTKTEYRWSEFTPRFSACDSCHYLNCVYALILEYGKENEELCRRISLLKHIPIEGLELLIDAEGTLHNLFNCGNGPELTKVAVEVIGPSRCLQNCDEPVGMLLMKQRQLEKLGYKVVMIFHRQIELLERKSDAERIEWLVTLLKQTANSPLKENKD